jgi:co-chaperonin GroES (HSP10)
MAKLKVKALGDRIRVKAQENKAGGLDISSYPTAVEFGEVVDIGPDVTIPIKLGDKIFYKSWAVDIISHEGEMYTFISQSTGGICAIVS